MDERDACRISPTWKHGGLDPVIGAMVDMDDSPLEFRVEAGSRPNANYIVKLDSFLNNDGSEFNGECQCDDFQMRCKANFLESFEISERQDPKRRTRCKHIKAALREFHRLMVLTVAIEKHEQEKQPARVFGRGLAEDGLRPDTGRMGKALYRQQESDAADAIDPDLAVHGKTFKRKPVLRADQA